jgi:hypothetical protein
MALSQATAVTAVGAPEAARYCGRLFAAGEMERIRALIAAKPTPNRAQLSRQVCRELGWLKPDGRPKDMACRVAMLRMHRDGLITLPAPLKGNGNGRLHPRFTNASAPRPPLALAAGAFGELDFRLVRTPQDSTLYNELIARHHYLGYKPLPGAQLRYLVHGGGHLLAALGFGAAAWAVAARDRFIGWTREQRLRRLHLVVNNARFLILPWISSPNLASRILGGAVKRLPGDWQDRYGYRPVLLETFVETGRFRGTCYRAANWMRVGQTQGRGKLDRHTRRLLPVKDILIYPLQPDFRRLFCAS